jgi:hypothetical protein
MEFEAAFAGGLSRGVWLQKCSAIAGVIFPAAAGYFLVVLRRLAGLRFAGTFFPFLRASESPIAIACLRLLTVPPLPPLPRFSLPFFRRSIARSTSEPALWEYLAMDPRIRSLFSPREHAEIL